MLSVKSVTCAYDGRTAVAQASLDVGPGEFVALAGPNGAGKTTLLRAAGRALKPGSGQVLLEGRDLYADIDPRSAARAIAVVPQDAVIEFDFTAHEVVLMGRHPHLGRFDAERDADRAAARVSMERTGTWDLRARLFPELSGGERRRVLLARALAQEAKLLLLDEPNSHLDLGFQVETLKIVLERVRAGGAAVAVLHDLNLAAAFATRIVLMREGRIVDDGPAAELLTEQRLAPVFGTSFVVGQHPDGRRSVLPRIA